MRHALAITILLAAAFLSAHPAATPAEAASFSVNTTFDATDANPGDGICATATGSCSLRAAIQETNASPGPDTITVPPGLYVLSLPGRGEDFAASGDLDIRQPL